MLLVGWARLAGGLPVTLPLTPHPIRLARNGASPIHASQAPTHPTEYPRRALASTRPLMPLPDGKVRKRRRSLNTPRHAHALTFSCHRGLPMLSRDRPRRAPPTKTK